MEVRGALVAGGPCAVDAVGRAAVAGVYALLALEWIDGARLAVVDVAVLVQFELLRRALMICIEVGRVAGDENNC